MVDRDAAFVTAAPPPPTRDVAAATAGKPVLDRVCKTPGCGGQANGRWDRGLFSGLCWDCVEDRRQESSKRMKAFYAEKRRKAIPAAASPAAAESLDTLGQALSDARSALREAQTAYRAAAARVLSHPCVQELPVLYREALIP